MRTKNVGRPLVGIIMGSDSDEPFMLAANTELEAARVGYRVDIVSAHRTPFDMQKYLVKAEKVGIKVVIAGAGGSAHLPGMSASHTPLTIIGVPVDSGKIQGNAEVALHSIFQMPPGVPVAVVGINASGNAALLALRMLAIHYPRIKKYLKVHKKQLVTSVEVKRKKMAKKHKSLLVT